MKRISKLKSLFLLCVTAVCVLNACNAGDSDHTPPSQLPEASGNVLPATSDPDAPEAPAASSEPQAPEQEKILIAYFSWSGNTERMAAYIKEQTGGDLYEIIPLTPYPTTSYTLWGESAREERDKNVRPEIRDPLPASTVAQYDTVFIGFPIWWHTAPMIIGTFLESYAWTDEVNIYPFFQGASNNNSEYYTNSMNFVRTCAQGAAVQEGLYAAASNTSAIDAYLAANGFTE